MGADREEQTAGENLGDRISSKGLSCIPMRVCLAGSEKRARIRNNGVLRWRIAGRSVESLKGTTGLKALLKNRIAIHCP